MGGNRLPPEYKAELCASMGVRLKEIRRAKGLTQPQVASRVGVHWVFYSRVERGRCFCSLHTLIKIADLYGVSMDALIADAPLEPVSHDDDSSEIEYIVDRTRDNPELARVVALMLQLCEKRGI